MEKEQFVKLILEAEVTMFHIAFAILHQEQDSSDAVQEAVVKAYEKEIRCAARFVLRHGS